MIDRNHFPLAHLIFALVVYFVATSVMAVELTPAQLVIQESSSRISKTLEQEEYQQDFSKSVRFVDNVVSDFVDMKKVSLLVLGKNIKKSSPEQRDRFMKEFKMLLTRTYTRVFLSYKNWDINFSPDRAETNAKKKLIKTEVIPAERSPVHIDYRMALDKKGDWKVYDILIEGISIVTNYRSTFNSEIARTGSLDSVTDFIANKNKSKLSNS